MASSDLEGVPTLVKSRIRAYLLSCTDHKEPLYSFESNYGKMYKAFKPGEYGFSSLIQLMQSIPDAVQISNQYGQVVLIGLPLQANKHIVNMIDKQKKPKKPKSKIRRDVGIFPRYQQAGYRSFPRNTIPRNSVFPPPPYQTKATPSRPSFPKPPPIRFPPQPKPVAKPTSFTGNQRHSAPVNSSTANRVSVYDRLGPSPAVPVTKVSPLMPLRNISNGDSVVSGKSHLKSQYDSRFYQIPQRTTHKENQDSAFWKTERISSNNKSSDSYSKVSAFDRLGPTPATHTHRTELISDENKRKIIEHLEPSRKHTHSTSTKGNVTTSMEQSINMKPKRNESSRQPSAPAPTPTPETASTPRRSNQPPPNPVSPSTDVEVYVDLTKPAEDNSNEENSDYDEGQIFSYDGDLQDSDFLKRLVRHLLATLDNPEDRTFTASGITSRMRRQLVRNGIDIPNYMLSIIYEFMKSSWDDCFTATSNGNNEETAEFTFTQEIKEAYRQPVRALLDQKPLTLNTMHTVKITHVSSPAFYVTPCSEEDVKNYESMTKQLKDYIEGDDPEDIFTYRTKELCAVYVSASNRFMRGRLQTFKIKVSQVDQSNIQLSLVAVIFLIDTGEQVTIPAGDVYALPTHFHKIPPFAYRCIFSGAKIIDQSRFTSVMTSNIDKEVELSVAVQQNSPDGLVLQVRVFASSYLMDDLVFNNIASKVTISEPEPKPFQVNKEFRVRFVNWHQGYRTVLVQRWSDEELAELGELEKQLGASVKQRKNHGLRKPLVNNFYVWLQNNGTGRRVRCSSITDQGLLVQCLDHGCRCEVTDLSHLFFPDQVTFSKCPFMSTSIPLAMIPTYGGENDVMLNRNSYNLKDKVRQLCPTHTILNIRHDPSISESPSFIVREDDEPSVNVQYLSLLMDMRNWPVNQQFSASVAPLETENGKSKGDDDWYRYIVRFDKDGCSPNLGIPLQEYRFMEQCCLEFTHRLSNGDTVMMNLTQLPASEIIDIQRKLVLCLPEENRAVRVTLGEPYLASCGGQVKIRLVDNPIDSVFVVESHQLYAFPKSSSRLTKSTIIDIDGDEMNHFRELLQNLPPLDQIVLSSSPLTCNLESPTTLQIVSFDSGLGFPCVRSIN